jgi:hypothetical protein
MPNSFKYSTDAQTLALKKGNFYIGTGDVDKGPTSTTGYWNGITPPAGGYTIYLNKSSGGPSIYVASNDSQLIDLTNKIAGTNYTTVTECLTYYVGQNDKVVLNLDYPPIVTNGLTTNIDVTCVSSYPNTSGTLYDLSSNGNNGSLHTGSPTFSTFDGKRSIRFSNNGKYVYSPTYDGYVLSNNPGISSSIASFTFETWFYMVTDNTSQTVIISNAGGGNGYRWGPQSTSAYWLLGGLNDYAEGNVGSFSSVVGRWVQMVGVFDRANTYGNGPKIYCYINGVNVGSATVPTANNMNIGTPGLIACCGAFDGYISIIRVYNRSLTPSEITQNFNAQKTYFGI